MGHLGADPELRTNQNNKSFCTINLATNEKWKDAKTGEQKERVEWTRVIFNGKQAENASKYLAKGDCVYVEGRLQTRKYEDDGQTKFITEIYSTVLKFITVKSLNKKDNDDEICF